MATTTPPNGTPAQPNYSTAQSTVLFADRIPQRLAAERLGVSFRTLRNWSTKGLIASFRFGGRIYFAPAELERFVRDAERPAMQEVARG